MNPLKLLQLKGLWNEFTSRHPKFPMFMSAVSRQGIQEGTIIEVKITSPDGRDYETNLKISQEDLELFQKIREIQA